ncbi:hypothetical protein BV22DRAFT_1132262 [Leucogyrophana mollusca]|uniref:Uncharacterized protein n=1 Tax=Leucogyrophana mollusca TaxID=85980 RepID=A0ACB8B701_9AGAM|nr:hypothetical protein BV22DRAFT_1132262 [Leucogyrophana mollusca]
MARKAKQRLTHKKRTRPLKCLDGLPTDQEWQTYRGFGKFSLAGDDGEQYEFVVNDTVFIVPEGTSPGDDIPPEKYWLGVIKEIRSKSDEEVFARIQWYWSGEEVASVVKSFPAESCAKRERIFSDYHDYVPVACIAAVMRYDERNVDQDPLDDDDFFCRFDFEYRARKILPQPTSCVCICKVPYNPESDTIMNFCPRPSCRTGYHQSCLLLYGHIDPDLSNRKRRLLEAWPDTDRRRTIDDIIAPDVPPPKRRKRSGSKASKSSPSSTSALRSFPKEIVEVAQQQIVKGTEAGGIVGNIRSVIAARSIIYDVLARERSIPEDWDDKIDVETAFPLKGSEKALLCFVCPRCQGPI